LLELAGLISCLDVIRGNYARVSFVLLGLVFGFLVFILSVVADVVCQYQLNGCKDLSQK